MNKKEETDDRLEISETFNRYFTEIGPSMAQFSKSLKSYQCSKSSPKTTVLTPHPFLFCLRSIKFLKNVCIINYILFCTNTTSLIQTSLVLEPIVPHHKRWHNYAKNILLYLTAETPCLRKLLFTNCFTAAASMTKMQFKQNTSEKLDYQYCCILHRNESFARLNQKVGSNRKNMIAISASSARRKVGLFQN